MNNKYPTTKPSLNLDFANTKSLDPRINFRRGTPGTYYDGVTHAKAEENLIHYSEDFNNSYWSTSEVSITENVEVAPDGNTTADKIIPSTNNSDFHTVRLFNNRPNLIQGKQYTVSCFLKKGGYDFASIQIYRQDGTRTSDFYFDLNNGVHAKTSHGLYSSGVGLPVDSVDILNVGSDWYRCVVTVTPDVTGDYQLRIMVRNDSLDPEASFAGDGTGGIYVWGGQIEQRDSVTSYTATSGTPITKYQPKLMTAAADHARFDHDPITGESKGLLIEEQRTNLVPSSNVSKSNYLSSNVYDYAIAPDGTQSAVYSTFESEGSAVVMTDADKSAIGNHCYSVYIKSAGLTEVLLADTPEGIQTRFYLDSNTYTLVGASAAGIEDAGNGWKRIWMVGSSAATSTYYQLYGYSLPADDFASVLWWGAQLEAGSFPTSYIKTTGVSATRSADNASITGENFSSWYRQDEGSFCIESGNAVDTNYAPYLGVGLDGGGDSYKFNSIVSIDNQIFFNNWNQETLTGGLKIDENGISEKIAAVYKDDDFAMSVNGSSVVSDTDGSHYKNMKTLYIGGTPYSGTNRYLGNCIKKISYYPQRLTNEQLQNLTK